MPTVRTAKHLLLESTTKSVESGTYDVICQFCTLKGMVVESDVLKAQSCALSKLSLPMHSNGGEIETGNPLASPGMVCYAEKQEKTFWISLLGQMVQFGAIIFCRTCKNFFGLFVWIEKKSHYNSRVSLHEAPTKNEFELTSVSTFLHTFLKSLCVCLRLISKFKTKLTMLLI